MLSLPTSEGRASSANRIVTTFCRFPSKSGNTSPGLPCTSHVHDTISLIVNRLTKSAPFPAIHMRDSLEKLALLYIDKVVRLHGVPISIVSYRIPRFTP